jgi:hypothetical protein
VTDDDKRDMAILGALIMAAFVLVWAFAIWF